MSHARDAGNRDQRNRKEEDGSGNEFEMPVTQVFQNKLGRNQRQRGVANPGQFHTPPMRAAEGERQSRRTW